MDIRSSDEFFLRHALELATRGPAVDPNPRVGCVLIVRDGSGTPRAVGEGWHRGAGTPHAEAAALSAAGEQAVGATAYVTLEPCAHTGRTGPCASALITAGVCRVVYAQADPNPVARGGAELLRDAGIEASGGLLAAEATALNEHWTFALTHGRPFVTWKFAATLDGRSAAADGSSRWITGERARADVHALRARAGAILAGTGTVLADDPQLTVRTATSTSTPIPPPPISCPPISSPATPPPPRRPPLRVIVGERDVPRGARVLDDAAPTTQLRTRDPHLVLQELHTREIRHAFLEGGPTLAAGFLKAGLIDELLAYLAPVLLGDGPPAIGSLGIENIGTAARFDLHDVTRIGDDVRLRLRPRRKPPEPAESPELPEPLKEI